MKETDKKANDKKHKEEKQEEKIVPKAADEHIMKE